VLLAFFTKSYPLFRLEQKSVRYFLTPQFLSAFASFIEKGLVLEKHYIATNFLGHGTVNPKANESDD